MKELILISPSSVREVGLGTGKITNPEEIETTVDTALRLGYRYLDTAFNYGNEVGIGNTLQKWMKNGKLRRDEFYIVTKLPMIGMHPSRVFEFMDLSLKNLQLEYVDLYLIHWPIGFIYKDPKDVFPKDDKGEILLDQATELEEIWKAMEQLVDLGKTRTIGLSNFNQGQINRILRTCRIPPSGLQIEVQIYFQQKKLLAFCETNEIPICAYAPLGSPGRRQFICSDKLKIPNALEDPVVKIIADLHGKSPAQILLRYMTQVLKVKVIPKSTSPLRLSENIQIYDFELTCEDIKRLEKLDLDEKGRLCSTFDGLKLHPECPF